MKKLTDIFRQAWISGPETGTAQYNFDMLSRSVPNAIQTLLSPQEIDMYLNEDMKDVQELIQLKLELLLESQISLQKAA